MRKQIAKVYNFYEMKTKSKKHKNMIETHTSAQIIYDTTDHFYRFILYIILKKKKKKAIMIP